MLFSLSHINSVSPYWVSEYEEDTAYFITDRGVEYLINFIEETNIGIDYAYQLVISNKSADKVSGTDFKIAQTVAAIVSSFFSNDRRVLLYICDTADKHEAARHRKFKSWFHRYANPEHLAMLTEIIEVEGSTFFVSAIYNRGMQEAAELQKTFHSYFQELRSKLD